MFKNLDLAVADSMLKKMFAKNKIKGLLIRLKEDGELEYLNSPEKLAFITQTNFEDNKKNLLQLFEKMEALINENESLKSEIKTFEGLNPQPEGLTTNN